MLRVHFTIEDLARTVVDTGPDPLWEILLSGHRLHAMDRPPPLRPWFRALRAGHPALRAGSRLLRALAPRGPYFPDFLTPVEARHGLEAGLDALCRTSRRHLRDQVDRLACHTRVPGWARDVAEGKAAAMRALAATLRGYHEIAVAPFTDLVAQSVAADHAHRMRAFATGGLDGLLANLSPFARWRPPVLEIEYPTDRDLHLAGRGLRIVPSYFCVPPPVSFADADLPPVLVYPVAQQYVGRPAPRHTPSLDALLGGTRSAVLRSVGGGATATQLAHRLGTSVSSVSRHAAVLRDAGLITSHRDESAVLHTLTALGAAMLGDGRA